MNMQLTYNHNLQIVNIHFSLSLSCIVDCISITTDLLRRKSLCCSCDEVGQANINNPNPRGAAESVVDCIVRVDDCCVFRDPTGVAHGSILMYRVRGCCRQVGG
jgi:hypothetical protein